MKRYQGNGVIQHEGKSESYPASCNVCLHKETYAYSLWATFSIPNWCRRQGTPSTTASINNCAVSDESGPSDSSYWPYVSKHQALGMEFSSRTFIQSVLGLWGRQPARGFMRHSIYFWEACIQRKEPLSISTDSTKIAERRIYEFCFRGSTDGDEELFIFLQFRRLPESSGKWGWDGCYALLNPLNLN